MEEAITFPEPEINSSSCRIIFVHRACSGGENEMIVVVKVGPLCQTHIKPGREAATCDHAGLTPFHSSC
jgi:hypothetical protein